MEQSKLGNKPVKSFFQWLGLPRIIIILFFVLVYVAAIFLGIDGGSLMGDVLRRFAMNGILVLAMVPAIKCGIGPNFGVSVGIVGGLLGALLAIELRYMGLFSAFDGNPRLGAFIEIIVAIVLAVIISGVLGILYGLLLNAVKGSEMTVSTYVGFSIVALMNIMWLVLPFRSPTSIWPLAGEGLRNNINLAEDYSEVFNQTLGFNIGKTYIPTGMILVFALACLVMWLFNRSRTGMMMTAAGTSPTYAKAAGVNVDRMRILGTAISTALGGVGIVCYAQSYGFLQLYNGPLMMPFACVAAVLIGGASIGKASIFNAVLGTFLFQGLLAITLPVANELLPEGNLSDVFRMIISYGIILYALSKAKGAGK